MSLMKQSTAFNKLIYMVDSSDHVTGKTGLTLTITASKDGAAFSSISPTVTELSNGWYKIALTTTHTNTLGELALHITSSGADPTDSLDQVVAFDPGVALATQSSVDTIDDFLDSEVAAILAAVDTEVALIKAKTDNLPAAPAAAGDIPTSAAVADAVHDEVIEGLYSFRELLRIFAASLAGKLSGAATTTVTIRDVSDSKNRIVATVDADGNRTAVTLDAS
jgi:hypothetical protein